MSFSIKKGNLATVKPVAKPVVKPVVKKVKSTPTPTILNEDKKIILENLAIVSTAIGTHIKKVYPAPLPNQSFFYSNNAALEKEVSNKGWKFIFIKDIPLMDDSFHNSLQSKKIKFLRNYPKEFRYILAVDHKLKLTIEIIIKILNKYDKPVLIRRSPALKTNVWTEFNLSQGQLRYAITATQLRNYINKLLKQGFKEETIICATGLILWDTKNPKSLALANNIYNGIVEANNPECQVIWGLWSQKYHDIIQIILWNDPTILWKAP